MNWISPTACKLIISLLIAHDDFVVSFFLQGVRKFVLRKTASNSMDRSLFVNACLDCIAGEMQITSCYHFTPYLFLIIDGEWYQHNQWNAFGLIARRRIWEMYGGGLAVESNYFHYLFLTS